MRRQTTAHILMVRPKNFAFNEETAVNNAFQSRDNNMTPAQMQANALREFDAFVKQLQDAGVQVIVAKDSARPVKPDAIFPNNWVTFHQEGQVITYPMFAPTRRRERRRLVIEQVLQQGFRSEKRINYEYHEKLNRFLEGTGSIIFDHQHRLAYACLSPRTDGPILEDLCKEIAYQPVIFHAADANGQEIYHTNVMMAMGETFVVICLDAVPDATERKMLEDIFAKTKKEIVDISLAQMNSFAGNMLQVRNTANETILVMSAQAYHSLTPAQVKTLEAHTKLLYADLHTIETYGGGSARCMMAEVFLPELG